MELETYSFHTKKTELLNHSTICLVIFAGGQILHKHTNPIHTTTYSSNFMIICVSTLRQTYTLIPYIGSVRNTPLSCDHLKLSCWLAHRELKFSSLSGNNLTTPEVYTILLCCVLNLNRYVDWSAESP